jgi:hypothetical protein
MDLDIKATYEQVSIFYERGTSSRLLRLGMLMDDFFEGRKEAKRKAR